MMNFPIALIFRPKTGCRQYVMYEMSAVVDFCSRHPYRHEVLTVLPVLRDGRTLARFSAPASEVAMTLADRLVGGVVAGVSSGQQ